MMQRQTEFERAHFLIENAEISALEATAYGVPGIFQQFMAFDEIRDYAKALPGVAMDTITTYAPLLPARTIVDGKHMVALLFNDAQHGLNIVAWCVKTPDQPYLWRDDAVYILGREQIEDDLVWGFETQRHETPLTWLQAGCKGIVVLG